MDKQYLDVEGGKHLTNKLKEYVQSKIDGIPGGGTVDLTDYYTKAEVNKIVSNISTGSSGTGRDGVGIASMKLVNYELIVTLTDGTEHNLGNIRGEKGEQGVQGEKGADGANGNDGFSPTVEVTNITDGHKVTITDKNGAKSFDVKDGKDGTSGSGSTDLSGYYTKEEVDNKLDFIEVEPTKDLLYETVVANGGAVKETKTIEVPVDDNFSDIILQTANGYEIQPDENGYFYVRLNKTQEELNAELADQNDKGRFHYLLASSFNPSDYTLTNPDLEKRLKNGEKFYYIIATKNNGNNTGIYFVTTFYNTANIGSDGLHYKNFYTIYRKLTNDGWFDRYEEMKNIKYICDGKFYNDGMTLSDTSSYFYNSKLDNSIICEYIKSGESYAYTVDNNKITISESISSVEFSKHMLDTYLTHKSVQLQTDVHYTLAEWGNKLDNNNGKDGKDGQDGISPTVTVVKEGKVATITCTDVNGTTTATISDGQDGVAGGSSSGGPFITYAYDTEIPTGETWIDGKPIYLKVFHIEGLESQSKIIETRQYYKQTRFADTVISINSTWYNYGASCTGSFMADVTSQINPTSSATSVANNINDYVIGHMMWCTAYNDKSFYITIGRGNARYEASCDVFIRYTKL